MANTLADYWSKVFAAKPVDLSILTAWWAELHTQPASEATSDSSDGATLEQATQRAKRRAAKRATERPHKARRTGPGGDPAQATGEAQGTRGRPPPLPQEPRAWTIRRKDIKLAIKYGKKNGPRPARTDSATACGWR